MKLLDYGKRLEVIRILKSNNNNGDFKVRDSNDKNISSRTESSIGDHHYSLINDDPIKKSRGNGNKGVAKTCTGETKDTAY